MHAEIGDFMSNNSRTEEIGLKEIEKIKLCLIWLSCKDFTLLGKAENHILLERVWANIKAELRQYFQSYEISLDSTINVFKKISLTIDPTLPAAYDPEKDVLIWNLWNLFVSLTQDPIAHKECVISSPGWKLGGELVHEYDHYQFAESGISNSTCHRWWKNARAQSEKLVESVVVD